MDALVVSTGGLALARFLADMGAFIVSYASMRLDNAFSAEILQDFAVDVQQRPIWVTWL